jgi:flagellar biosynthetic protein FliQ
MSIDQSVDVVKGLMMLCLKVSMPFLLSAMIIGLIVSFFQAITSLQEQTLTFVPKALVVVVVVFILFPWLMNTMLDYTAETFNRMSQVGP